MPERIPEQFLSPVHEEQPERREPEEGIALCLSGGGYRAMLFHLGALWRLSETGYLAELKRISSVSGGSITAGALACEWAALLSGAKPADAFSRVVSAIRTLASRTIDVSSVAAGLLLPGTASDRVVRTLDDTLFHGKTLQDLPEEPRFVINATNVQSGSLWRFSKPYVRDWRVGRIDNPRIPLAVAVAASAAFPPFLSPLRLQLEPSSFAPSSGDTLQAAPYTSKVYLTDGGVYDNLGLETAWKRYRTILVSDGGGQMPPEPKPATNWASHSKRVLDLIDNQVRSLRKRQVIGSFELKHRSGTYWGIRTSIANYGLQDNLPCPHARTIALADIDTRLKRLDVATQERLINWGYAVCDAAVRRWVKPSLQPGTFPYPRGV